MMQEMNNDIMDLVSSSKYVDKIHCVIKDGQLIVSQGAINHVEFEKIVFKLKDELSQIVCTYGIRVCGEGGRLHLDENNRFVLVFPRERASAVPIFPDCRHR